jgi:hypothetical protein
MSTEATTQGRSPSRVSVRGEDASTESFGFHDQLCPRVDRRQRSLLSSMR